MHQHHTLREFEALARSELNPATSGRMQALDETGKHPALNWSRRQTIAATNWVGTMQVPGWSVDILPKTGFGELPENAVRGRLLRMLAIAGMLPIEERDLRQVTAIEGRLLDGVLTASPVACPVRSWQAFRASISATKSTRPLSVADCAPK